MEQSDKLLKNDIIEELDFIAHDLDKLIIELQDLRQDIGRVQTSLEVHNSPLEQPK
ncbi:hypothetical protein RJG79_12325 [Mycoplasmatota bacterium WC44]